MGNVVELRETDFEAQVLQSPTPVLVDFWAPWCGPCRALTPILERMAVHNAQKVKMVKVNIDESQRLAQTYDINAVPTLMIFKNGEVVDRFLGVPNEARLQSALDEAAT